jgi:integrase
VDPTDAKRDAIIQRAAALKLKRTLAFNSDADQFLNQRVTERGLRREAEIRSIFLRDLIPYFKSQPITSITKKDVDGCLRQIGKRSHSSANKAYRWLKHIFNCAVLDDDIPKSPLDRVKMPFAEPSRDRVLDDRELVDVWCASAELGYPFGPMIQMLIATGQRLREVAEVEWSELDLAKREWVIPPSRTKDGKKHVVPLNGRTIDILIALLPMRSDNCSYAFTTSLTTPVSGFSRAKKRLDALVSSAHVAIPNWTFHDLRRTFATGCQRLGIPIAHTEALLNHSNSTAGLVGVYQRHDYGPEKILAATAWNNNLSQLLTSEAKRA